MARPKGPLTPPEKKALAERRKRALDLRIAGATLAEIAEAHGVSISTTHEDIRRCLSDIPKASADELRKQEIARLDKLQNACWQDAIHGDLSAIDRALKVIDRRAKMLGLDAPQQVEVTGVDVDLDATVARIMAVADAVSKHGDEVVGGE